MFLLEFNLTPRQIVAELDRFIIGQTQAKKIGGNSFEEQMAR